jgi:multidrug efflux pump subunit AcrB
MKRLTMVYKSSLKWLLSKKRRAFMFLFLSFGALALAIFMILPDIPKEIISTPTSDRIVLFYRNTVISDPEAILNDVLPDLNAKIDEALGERQVQKFSSLSGRFNQTFIDLRSSEDTEEAIADLEKIFVSEGDWYYNVMSWDPAALPLPMSFDFQLSLFGPDPAVKIELLTSIQNILNEEEFYRRVFSRPSKTLLHGRNLHFRG